MEIDYDDVKCHSWTIQPSYLVADKSESDNQAALESSGGFEMNSHRYSNLCSHSSAEETHDFALHDDHNDIIFTLSIGFLR